MTLQQMRYIVDVEESGSITKSAANLFVSQPNLSTALKELESEIGMTIFRRSSKGVETTPEGAQFISYARGVLTQVDKMEFVFKNAKKATTLTMACIRSSYMTRIFSQLYNRLPKDTAMRLSLYETTPGGVFSAVANGWADVGKLSFMESEHAMMQARAQKSRMVIDLLWRVRPYILVSAHSPLAGEPRLTMDTLSGFTQVTYGDFAKEAFLIGHVSDTRAGRRRIDVCDRGTLMDMVSNCHDSYMWTTSAHPDVLRMYQLTAIPCEPCEHVVEAIVYQNDRAPSREAQWLIDTYRAVEFAGHFHGQEPIAPMPQL